MLEKLKSQLDQTLEKIDDLDDYFEDRAEDFSDEMTSLWGKTKAQLNGFGDQVRRGVTALDQESDHIALQAHLATMDARDQWDTLRASIESSAQNIKRDGKLQLDEAALQTHLGAMDGRDFINAKGDEIERRYQQTRRELEESTLKAATDIKKAFDGLIGGLPK
ncbi:MAG: hypothetical protein ACRBBW_15365 [Cellvibrionaceae bacterium]